MADDSECDVGTNGEVFEDVASDPGSMINNVESCSKMLIPSMAQHSMSKLSADHEETESTESIFQSIKHDVEDVDDDEHNTSDHNNDEDKSEIKRRLSSVSNPRAVKWSSETMAAAMDAVFAGELTTTSAARKFQIPRTTLLDRLSLKAKRQHFESPGSFPLNLESDAQVVDFIKRNDGLDKPTLIRGMISLAEELAKMQGRPFENPLSTRKWLKLFVQKHPSLDILRYSRTRNASSRSSVSMSSPNINSRNRKNSISTSSPSHEVSLPQIIIQQYPGSFNSALTATIAPSDEVSDQEERSPSSSEQERQKIDPLEANLARQGAKAIEEKLNAEQMQYFKYRFLNKSLEKGYELWKLCKSQADFGDNFSLLALNGVEQGLSQEHVKYFMFRYENSDLEEGYKLWSYLTERIYT